MGENFQMMTDSPSVDNPIKIKKVIGFVCIAFLIVLGLKSSVITLAAFGILAVYLCAADESESAEALLFFLSFMNIFKTNKESTSLFTYLQLVPIAKILMKRFKELNVLPFVSSIIMLFYSIFMTVFISFQMSALVRFTIEICLLLVYFGTDAYKKLSSRNMTVFYALGVLVSSVFGKMNNIFPEIDSYLSLFYVRLDADTVAYRFSGLISNANYYSIEVTVSLASLLILFRRNVIDKLFYVLSIPLIIFGIMSQSKTFIISLVLIFMFFVSYVYTHKNVQNLIMGMVIVVFLLTALSGVIASFAGTYMTRLLDFAAEDATVSSMTTGRWDIWLYYYEEMMADKFKLFTGHGLEVNAVRIAPHNMFIQSFYSMGIIGTVLIAALLTTYFIHDGNKKDVWFFVGLLIIRLLAANLLFYPNTYYYLMLLFSFIYCFEKDIRSGNTRKEKLNGQIV